MDRRAFLRRSGLGVRRPPQRSRRGR
jgi:hypothetical protein